MNTKGTAVGFHDSHGLSFLRCQSDWFDYLKLDRGEPAESSLAARAVIRPLDPDHDLEPQFLPCLPPVFVEQVLLKECEEGLHGGVITAGSSPGPSTR
jgi:hypothetical protein